MSACLNCGAELAGPWCHACGQRATTGRLHLGELTEHALNALFGVDAAFPRTVRDLTLRPGETARDYVEGKRKRYVSPVQYFLTSLAVLFVVFSIRGVRPSAMATERVAALPFEVQDAVAELLLLMDTHLQFVVFTSIPFFAWSARLLQRRAGFTFAESCVAFLYAVAHAALLACLPRLLFGLGTPALNLAIGLGGLVYYTWAARGFYRCGWLRAATTIVVAYVAWIALLGLEMIVIMSVVMALSMR